MRRDKMKRKTTKRLVILVIALTILLASEIAFLVWNKFADKTDVQEIQINTPYCTLYFPGTWQDMLRTEQTELPEADSLVVAFYGKLEAHEDQHVFDILIQNEKTEDSLGAILCTDGEKRYVTTVFYSTDSIESWPETDKNLIYAMQEDINYIIDKLPLLEEELISEETDGTQPVMTEAPEYEAVAVNTPYATMYYPGEWAQYLRTEHTEAEKYTVNFYAAIDTHPELLLFSISFGDVDQDTVWIRTLEDGSDLGVDVVFYSLQLDGWDADQTQIALLMQESGNDLMQQLELKVVELIAEEETIPAQNIESGGETDKNAVEGTVLQQTDPAISEGDMVVETPYGQLKYPKKWSEQIRIEQGESIPVAVTFYAKIGEHEEEILFSVLFDANEGAMVGTVADSEGNFLPVSLIFGELSDPDEWTETEQDVFYAMQEDANYLVEQLDLVLVTGE